MSRQDQQEKKDAAHMWFGLAIAGILAAGIAFAAWRNGVEGDRARVAGYAGRDFEPDRGPVVGILIATVAIAALIGLWWWSTVRRASAILASTPDAAALDHLFSGDQMVPVRAGHAGMGHSVIVVGARERGYVLTSQGTDGSMVFEREPNSVGSERTGKARVAGQQSEDQAT